MGGEAKRLVMGPVLKSQAQVQKLNILASTYLTYIIFFYDP